MSIHPTAIVDPAAQIGTGTVIGPYCIIGPDVVIGENCWLQHHVTVCGPTHIGSHNRFYAYGSIGQQTQDLKYAGEPTGLEIGDNNTFREFVSVHRSTFPGEPTRVGSHGNFLAYVHIAHDCVVGDHCIFSNNATLAGHVHVEHHVIIGGLTPVHQFCRIGCYAMIGGCTRLAQDAPPYMIAEGSPAEIRALNSIGLDRNGFSKEAMRELKDAFKILFRSKLNFKEAIEEVRKKFPASPEICHLVEFIESTQRGVTR